MPSPPIQLFLTTIASAPALRQKQEYLLRTLQVKRIPFVSYDLASDPNAKRLWRRKAPKEQPLPGMLVGGVWPGSFEQFFEAVERGELETFLRLNEDYDPDIDGKVLPAGPIGVPGAAMPLQMQGHKASFAPNGPTPMRKPEEEVDAGEVLPGFGLQGFKVTVNELTDLVKELGLNDKEANNLAQGLKPSGSKRMKESKELKEDTETKELKEDTETKELKEDTETKELKEDTETKELKEDTETKELKEDKAPTAAEGDKIESEAPKESPVEEQPSEPVTEIKPEDPSVKKDVPASDETLTAAETKEESKEKTTETTASAEAAS